MTVPRVVFDTNAILRHRLATVPGLMSAVVLQELTAGAGDDAEVRRFGLLRAVAEADGALVTPDGEDWWFAGKVLNALYRGLPSHRHGPTPAIPKEEQRRLLRDVLIARSAKRVNAAVATYDRSDFEKIRRFCNVRLEDPAVFL